MGLTDTAQKMIALSVDDGPNPESTENILEVLRKYGAKATFFFVGAMINRDTQTIVRSVAESGCEIGNHGFDFSNLSLRSRSEILDHYTRTQEAIYNAAGVYPTLFRPAGTKTSDALYSAIPVPVVGGHLGCTDWESTVTVEQRITAFRNTIADGRIMLIHDVPLNVKALETLLPEFVGKGYQIVTVSELAARKGVEFTPHEKKVYREF